MLNIKFDDNCKIWRETNANGEVEYDEWDNPIVNEPIYDGKCSYQAGGQTSLSVVVRNDVVYLPSNDVIIEANDVIEVATKRGRVRKGVIRDVRDIEMPMSGERYTKIEIKQSKEE